jgi:hypothetical protein
MTQVVEYLPSKQEALNSDSQYRGRIRKRRRRKSKRRESGTHSSKLTTQSIL